MKQIVILALVAIIFLLIGILVTKNSSSSAPAYQMPADDGKLAKSYKEENLVKKIRENAKELQSCYFQYLDSKPEMQEGVIKLLFKVEENGFIKEIQVTENDFKNKSFEKCVEDKLEDIYLSPPPLGINRFISHEIAFKSEETALKEAKEREEKNQPPKVLPVN